MKRICLLSLILFVQSTQAQNLGGYVNLFLGTGGDHGQLDPSACVPFGMMKLGPDTEPGNHGGYNFDADHIRHFSHNRISGVGCSGSGGNLGIVPIIGTPNAKGYAIDKATESAKPGYYTIGFTNKIKAELTATNYTGYHHYQFPASDSAAVLYNPASAFAGLINWKHQVLNKHEMVMTIEARNTCGFGRYIVYYHVWSSKDLSGLQQQGDQLMHYFATKPNEQVQLQVSVSGISTSDAKDHWYRVSKTQSFQQVAKTAANLWEQKLAKIIVTGDEANNQLFYSLLYRVFLNPVLTVNTSKKFRGTDGNIHTADPHHHYDGWSMWDNYRNKFALLSIIESELTQDILYSLADLYKYGKTTWGGYFESTPTVRTDHTIITILDLLKRGYSLPTLNAIYPKMVQELSNTTAKSPDAKLELCYDFWALSELAGFLKKPADQQLFYNRAMEYKTVWKEKFMTITDKFDIMHGDGLYEGTLWQYRWHVQFDIPGIIGMVGGPDTFTNQLKYFFENHLYNHGNQPDLHAAYLFNMAGKPGLTQKWVNNILAKDMEQHYGTHSKWKTPYFGKIYKNQPAGFIPEMDDDEGTMSAWYVMSAIGLYPVKLGDPSFQLTTPLFSKVTLDVGKGKKFIIQTENLSANNIYMQSATLHGLKIKERQIEQQAILKGGLLKIEAVLQIDE